MLTQIPHIAQIPGLQAALDAKAALAAPTFTGSVGVTGGTVAADAPVLNLTQTWNNAGVGFTALKLNITDTASAAASKLLDLQLAGVSKFAFRKDGQLTLVQPGANPNTACIYFSAAGYGIHDAASQNGGIFISNAGLSDMVAFNNGIGISNGKVFGWAAAPNSQGKDTGMERYGAGVVMFTNGAGTLRDFRTRRGSITEYAALEPVAEPASPATGLFVFCVDNAGKMELKVKAPSGDVGTLYAEP